MTGDLLSLLNPPCGDCTHLGAAIPSGVRYCPATHVWRWSTDRTDCACRMTPAIKETRQ